MLGVTLGDWDFLWWTIRDVLRNIVDRKQPIGDDRVVMTVWEMN